MKKFVLLRGESGMLYAYGRALWEYMLDTNSKNGLEFVLDHDDREVLEGYQKLVNKDIEIKG